MAGVGRPRWTAGTSSWGRTRHRLGAVWRYDLAYVVLGVLLGVVLARAGGSPLEQLLRERLLDPLGMADTGFVAPPGRLPPCYAVDGSGLVLFDGAATSRWSTMPSFPDARGGLMSTARNLLRFASALLDGGGLCCPGTPSRP